ncbi:beta-N-acetylhexosaminidase [Limnovirga soli]|uniref:beta-N-acetylhexosaminidase n=1 Tax=Limnovirga soli TaxID=2656915 RepID=A0A8J8FBK7_9BACT|nr:beta-N-acetylhexosaminidase [Limnovirga soli]NNV55001.1 family 20 glycosylhydrolase [Limnovirga soli]
MKQLLFAICTFFVLAVNAQEINIIPQPASLKQGTGSFTISATTKIILAGSGTEKSAAFLNAYLKAYYGFELSTTKAKLPWKNAIVLNYDRMDNGLPGAYNLTVDKEKVYIGGDNEQGVFYGIQTLLQLLPVQPAAALAIPNVTIADAPRFAYRGLMLDCGRHFFSVDFVKQYIDFIAMSKMNTFHWHLTEDQGWRIEIKKYPLLTQVGSCRNGTITGHHPGTGNDNIRDCGYYTQEQIKDIVKYAADRYITVIPEIEMPGHSSAAIAAYPQLSCFPTQSTAIAKKVTWSGDSTGKHVQQSWGVYSDVFCPSEYTFNFLQDVLDEVMALFPSTYIHIGGDECPKEYWKISPFCQQLIKDKGLKDEHGLQSYFIGRIEKYLNGKGRQIIGWDEILEGGVAPNATVMSWRGEKGGIEAAKQKHQVVMTPTTYVYFDYAQTKSEDSLVIGGYLPVETVYNYEPLPKELTADEQKYILGAQANVWSEYMANPGKVEYMLLPRLAALSEVLWSTPQNKSWAGFTTRLQTQFKRFDLWKAHYNKKGINKGE